MLSAKRIRTNNFGRFPAYFQTNSLKISDKNEKVKNN